MKLGNSFNSCILQNKLSLLSNLKNTSYFIKSTKITESCINLKIYFTGNEQ